MSQKKAQFATRLGVIAATVGSAVGLGNIWRFPYEAGVHGGAAFLLVYIFFILVVGIPVICAEFVIGRHTGMNICGAFRKLKASGWFLWLSYTGLAGAVLILSFYSVVAGWTMEYIYLSVTDFHGVHSVDALHEQFDAFAASDFRPAMWVVIFLLINYFVVARGLQQGIEKISNILMPLLFAILLVFCVNSLMMPKAGEGLEFLFKPDFSKITPSVMMGAMGQSFFSLSLGLGTLITYAGYFKKETPLVRTAFTIGGLDTLVALLAGVIIFPAVFSFNSGVEQGPKLVFEVLPSIFSSLPGGMIWAVMFFVLLFVASLTSTISMSEIVIAYLIEEHKISRRRATIINIGVCMVLGVICALSFGCLRDFTVFGFTVFNLFDYVSSNILLPLGGIGFSVFVGWVLDKSIVREELTEPGHSRRNRGIVDVIVFCLRYIAPTCIAIVFIAGL